MKLSERKRKDLRPTPAGDCVYFWLDDIEELEKLETQFEAELKAVKNDYERIKQLEAENAAAFELLDVYEKENERLRELLDNSRKCIRSVEDQSVFGIGGEGMTHWYLSHELLNYIDDALKEGE